MDSLLFLIIAIPAASAAILLLGGKYTDAWGHWLGVAAADRVVRARRGRVRRPQRAAARRHCTSTCSTWIDVGSVQRRDGAAVRPAVGALRAAHHRCREPDPRLLDRLHGARRPPPARSSRYLNLFVAAMLMLVLATDYLALFLGWEGVGLASYLLIGFWQHKDSAAVAAKKAFVVNRVGDIGMALAIMLMFKTFGSTLLRGRRRRHAELASDNVATALSACCCCSAACGKSAQVPLQSWLLDAMEGPTPVSALIHAATMVTAGVYLVTRSNFIYDHSRGSAQRGRDRRTGHAALGCDHRLRQGRHQEGSGRLDDEPDRLHDAGRRSRSGRLRLRDLPPAHARLLQGQPVPRCRLGDARDERRGRHAALRRAGEDPADHVRHVRLRLPRDHRLPAASPASSPRTRSSRPRSATTSGSG